MFRAGAPVAQHGWPRDALIYMRKEYVCTKPNVLIPNAFIEADGALRDGNVPAAVSRPRLDRDHRWFGCDP